MGNPRQKKSESKQDYLKRCTEQRVADGDDARTAFARCSARLAADADGLALTAPVHLAETVDDQPRGFMIVAKSAAPITQWGWTTAIDIAGMETETRMPILREHMRDRVVGSGQAFKDGNKLYVEGAFSTVTADGAEVLALADEGYPWQASIGVWAREVKTIEAGETTSVNGIEIRGPADVWTKSYVREVSFVTLGADERTAAIALAEDHSGININLKEKNKMDIKQLRSEHPELVEVIFGEGHAQGLADGIEQERGRVVEILGAEADPEQTRIAIADGTLAGDAYKAFFAAEKAKRAQGLKDLAAQATPPQGQGRADDQGDPDAGLPADKVVARRAKALSVEKNIPYEKAHQRVLRDDPEMAKKYRALYAR